MRAVCCYVATNNGPARAWYIRIANYSYVPAGSLQAVVVVILLRDRELAISGNIHLAE